MNSCTVVGRIGKYAADMRTYGSAGKRFLSCTVVYDKLLPNQKRFEERFKVMMFGPSGEALCPKLQPGTLVAVSGEVGIDRPQEGKQGDTMLKIVGNITVLEPAPKPVERPRPAPTERESDGPPPEEEDVPF